MIDGFYPSGIVGLEWRVLKGCGWAAEARKPLDIEGCRKGEMHIFFDARCETNGYVKEMDIIVYHYTPVAVDVSHTTRLSSLSVPAVSRSFA